MYAASYFFFTQTHFKKLILTTHSVRSAGHHGKHDFFKMQWNLFSLDPDHAVPLYKVHRMGFHSFIFIISQNCKWRSTANRHDVAVFWSDIKNKDPLLSCQNLIKMANKNLRMLSLNSSKITFSLKKSLFSVRNVLISDKFRLFLQNMLMEWIPVFGHTYLHTYVR